MTDVKQQAGDASRDDAAWAARIAFYGLDLKDASREPVVAAEGECIRLTPRVNGGGRFDDRLKRVPVESVRDLKRLIGTPDKVIRSQGCLCADLPSESMPSDFKALDDLDSNQHRALYAASNAYLHGDSARVAYFEPVLERAFQIDKRHYVGVLFLQDLVVERNATVVLGGNINVALFRHVIIKRNGKLRIEKNLKIDCVSIQGEGFFSSQVFDRGVISTAIVSGINR